MAFYIPIIVGSTRRDRQSIKVARFVLSRLQQRRGVETERAEGLIRTAQEAAQSREGDPGGRGRRRRSGAFLPGIILHPGEGKLPRAAGVEDRVVGRGSR